MNIDMTKLAADLTPVLGDATNIALAALTGGISSAVPGEGAIVSAVTADILQPLIAQGIAAVTQAVAGDPAAAQAAFAAICSQVAIDADALAQAERDNPATA